MINIAAAMGLGNSPAIRSLNNIQTLLTNLIKVKSLDYKQEERDRAERILLQKRELQDFKTLEDSAKKQKDLKQVGIVDTKDGKMMEALLLGGLVLGGLTVATNAIGGVVNGIKGFFANVGNKVKEFLGIDHEDTEEPSAAAPPSESAAGDRGNIATSGSGTAFEHYKYLTGSLGLSDIHARGLIANAMRESSLNPKARSGDDGGPGGLFQWKGSRQTETVRKLVESGDWKGQYKYALTEDVGPQYQPKNFRTANQAANWWAKHWERPLHQHDHQKFIDSMGFQTGGLVSMKPRFSPVLKTPPTIKLQTGGAVPKSGSNPSSQQVVDKAAPIIMHHEALSSLTPGVNDYIFHGGNSVKSRKPWAKVDKPDTPIHAYPDGGGVPTIGWGSIYNDSMLKGKSSVKMGDVWPKSKADSKLKSDAAELLAYLKSKHPFYGKMTLDQQAGFLSQHYNTGAYTATDSNKYPKFKAAFRAGKVHEAAKAHPRSGGPQFANRIADEQKYMMNGPATFPVGKQRGGVVGMQSGGFVSNSLKKSPLLNIPNMIKRRSGGMISQSRNPNLPLENQYDKGFYTRQANSVQAPTVVVLNKSRTKQSPPINQQQKPPQSGGGSDPNYYSYGKMYSNYCRGVKA